MIRLLKYPTVLVRDYAYKPQLENTEIQKYSYCSNITYYVKLYRHKWYELFVSGRLLSAFVSLSERKYYKTLSWQASRAHTDTIFVSSLSVQSLSRNCDQSVSLIWLLYLWSKTSSGSYPLVCLTLGWQDWSRLKDSYLRSLVHHSKSYRTDKMYATCNTSRRLTPQISTKSIRRSYILPLPPVALALLSLATAHLGNVDWTNVNICWL